ncbi:low-density lipoprotein receptor-related protein 4-like [Saccostrea echinata]|uniref:low-density lipoprotein receptor-related protein 4-like n=1 Tax=Saccostrea echinata TaxID=191078 RepID=UPI002A8186FE|nr:low-density lipoprotein receptor-related protein 4-like [Saccostrea echinata]
MAIDYSTGNIYYTAVGSTSSQSYIGVIHRTTFQHKTLLSDLHSPREIVVYPSKGFLFWTEFGNLTEIGRAYMDGSSKTYIATTDIGWPNGLAIDFISDRIYWTDGQKNRIEFSDLNGGNRRVLTTDNDAHLMSIVVHGQYLYYTAWNRQRITKMHKTTGSKVTFMSNNPELGRLDSLAIYADDVVDVSLSCSQKNGGCSTFCFPKPTGRTCGCQDNVDLQSDQTICQGEILCPSPVGNVMLSSICTRRVGDSCTFKCAEGYISTISQNLLCTNDGTWNYDTKNLCIPSPSTSEDKTIAYIGMSAGIILAIIIIAAVCFTYRRKPHVVGQEYQSAPAARNNIYATFKNGGYMTDSSDLPERSVSDVYCSIDDTFATEYEEPLKDTYLNPLTY